MDLNRVVELISEVLSLEHTENDEDITFQKSHDDSLTWTLPREELQELASQVPERSENEATRFFTHTAAEFLVRHTGPIGHYRMRDGIKLDDDVDGFHYRLGSPSIPFAFWIADQLSEMSTQGGRRMRFVPPSAMSPRMRDSEVSVLDLFLSALRIYSLRIESVSRTPPALFQTLADSFYFHVGYNLDFPVVPQVVLQESLRRTRIQRIRRSADKDLDGPHKKYIAELVHNYQLAISTDSPTLSYLSYYHVAEHWFEEVFQNDIAVKLQSAITAPSFSYRRMKDLRKLVKIVSDEVKSRDDELVMTEQTALKLTLVRYVDIVELLQSLDEFDPTLADYYSSSTVPFSDGDRVNLREATGDGTLAALARRIYKTRNALVHRKNGSRSRFAPFKDDYSLEPEIPLMRFVAEQIIISTASI